MKNRRPIGENSFSLKLDNPTFLLKYINPKDYMSDQILNAFLVHEIMMSENQTYIKNLIDKVCESRTLGLDFINYYTLQSGFKDSFLNTVIKSYKKLWIDIEDYSGISKDNMIFLFGAILCEGDMEDLIALNLDGRFSKYLSQAPYHAYFDLGLTQDKFKALIKTLDIKIKHIKGSSDDGITRFLYNGNFYQQNKHNLFLIIEKYSDLDLTLYSNAIYSAIIDANIEPLRSQVERNIEDYTKTHKKVNVLSNENYQVITNNFGESYSKYKNNLIYDYKPTNEKWQGINVYIKNLKNRKIIEKIDKDYQFFK